MSTKSVLGVVTVVLLSILAYSFSQQSETENGLAESLLANSNFDKSVEPWRTRSSWSVEWTDAEGGGSAKVTASSEKSSMGRLVLSQCINLAGSSVFELGGRFKQDERSTQAGGGRIRITWFDEQDCAGNGSIDPSFARPESLSGWQQLRVDTLTAPASARSTKVSINQSVEGAGSFTAYWDDIYLRPMSVE